MCSFFIGVTHEFDILATARAYAMEAHVSQSYGELPCHAHLASVEAVLCRFGVSDEDEDGRALLVAAWLHNVVEDTDRTIDDIRSRFGPEMAKLVAAVTNEPERNGKGRVNRACGGEKSHSMLFRSYKGYSSVKGTTSLRFPHVYRHRKPSSCSGAH